ncbi:MAG: DUF1553 domain-containing protein, partial [Planctomycetota bacterium]
AEAMAKVLDLDFADTSYQQAKEQAERFKETFFRGTYSKQIRKHSYQGNVLCRASELPSPVPSAHFLRQFGQGDRETINGSDLSATVPQILAMFNGPITHVMLENGSSIFDDLMSEANPRDRIEAIFLSVLSRKPSHTDRRIAAAELQQNKGQGIGYGNIVWALLNTREFMFIH